MSENDIHIYKPDPTKHRPLWRKARRYIITKKNILEKLVTEFANDKHKGKTLYKSLKSEKAVQVYVATPVIIGALAALSYIQPLMQSNNESAKQYDQTRYDSDNFRYTKTNSER